MRRSVAALVCIAQALAFLQPLFLRNKLWGLLIRHDTPSHPSRFASLRPQSKGSWCAEREDLLFSYFRCVYYKAQHPFTKLARSLDMDVAAFSYFLDHHLYYFLESAAVVYLLLDKKGFRVMKLRRRRPRVFFFSFRRFLYSYPFLLSIVVYSSYVQCNVDYQISSTCLTSSHLISSHLASYRLSSLSSTLNCPLMLCGVFDKDVKGALIGVNSL